MGKQATFLIKLVDKYIAADKSQNESEKEIYLEQIKAVGRTAHFLGDYNMMKELHDAAAYNSDPERYDIADHLNRMWDGIGNWWR